MLKESVVNSVKVCPFAFIRSMQLPRRSMNRLLKLAKLLVLLEAVTGRLIQEVQSTLRLVLKPYRAMLPNCRSQASVLTSQIHTLLQ